MKKTPELLRPGAHFAQNAKGEWVPSSRAACDWHSSCIAARVLDKLAERRLRRYA